LNRVKIALQCLPHGEGLPMPNYATAGSVGLDLPAAVNYDLTLMPGKRALVPTGFAMALPDGFEAQIRPRSGLAAKHGVTVLNAPGTIDWDYRGEIMVVLINFGEEDYVVKRGAAIAQMVIAPVTRAIRDLVKDLPETVRGSGGFGSTDRHRRLE
jgi:dUTP pyrophosphatase